MIKGDYEIKYQACNLCDALHRNINDNFIHISFDISESGDIQVKIALKKITPVEDDLIDDIIGEFSAKQLSNCVLAPIIKVGENIPPLKHVIYKQL